MIFIYFLIFVPNNKEQSLHFQSVGFSYHTVKCGKDCSWRCGKRKKPVISCQRGLFEGCALTLHINVFLWCLAKLFQLISIQASLSTVALLDITDAFISHSTFLPTLYDLLMKHLNTEHKALTVFYCFNKSLQFLVKRLKKVNLWKCLERFFVCKTNLCSSLS